MPSALISAGPLRGEPGPFRTVLTEAGWTCIDTPGVHTLTRDELDRLLPQADAILAGGEDIPADLLAQCPKLRVIARAGVGYDAVDVPAATKQGIAVTIAPGTNQESVAEHTFALLLAATRRIADYSRVIHAGGWDRDLVMPVRNRTLGLVGLGRIGRAVVVRARAFRMKVVAFDPVADPAFDAEFGVERLGLEELLAASDFVSLHLPISPTTRHLINSRTLALMKPGSILVNTARGGLVNELDLRDALVSGHLAAAALDVLNHEPPEPGNPLLGLRNVVLAPHLGGLDTDSMRDMGTAAARCIVNLFKGDWPADSVVNPEVKPRFAS
ncbi:MAG: phosphoglycerate dehydrogenase [Planctomycetota bacterium]|nr:phosphoglycerate dehydrogenase [Planctomycetota bacterium]